MKKNLIYASIVVCFAVSTIFMTGCKNSTDNTCTDTITTDSVVLEDTIDVDSVICDTVCAD